MSITNLIKAGMNTIPLKVLREMGDAADRTRNMPGLPAAAAVGSVRTFAPIPVFVVERGVAAPAPLSEHTYKVAAAGNEWDITWEHLRVVVPFRLVDPSAEKRMLFAPAAVVGSDEHAAQHWRAEGFLYRMPATVDGKPSFHVELAGLTPDYGCPEPTQP